MKKYKHLTQNARYQIYAFKKSGWSDTAIAAELGVDKATVGQEIAQVLAADFYFCHPYSSWERGINENTNGLIRQYFPRQMKFATITDRDIKLAQAKLNNRPRKTLGYQTPNEVYFKDWRCRNYEKLHLLLESKILYRLKNLE